MPKIQSHDETAQNIALYSDIPTPYPDILQTYPDATTHIQILLTRTQGGHSNKPSSYSNTTHNAKDTSGYDLSCPNVRQA